MLVSDLSPILASLRKHKLAALLLMLQTMFVCAIVCNILTIVLQRVSIASVQSGLNEETVSVLEVQSIASNANWVALHDEALHSLRELPGVTDAAVVDTLPLGGSESTYAVCSSLESFARAIKSHTFGGAGCMQPAILYGTQGELATLGLKLVAGRNFLPEEYSTQNVTSAIVSRSLAERLFPDKEALGQTFYSGAGADHPIRVIGVVDHLIRPNPHDAPSSELTMLWPMLPNESDVIYVLKSSPANRDYVLREAIAKLRGLDSNLIIPPEKVQTFASVRSGFYRRDLAMIELLLLAVATLLFVTAVGIAGLAKFWVQQRIRHVGIRRALGATRRDILIYFLTENFLIVGVGVGAGIPLAYVLNALLMSTYAAPQLSVSIVPACALALIALGQLATFAPAFKASTASPIDSVRYRG